MKTRREYLNKECTHREYYGQFVNERYNDRILLQIKRHYKKQIYIDNLNEIPLQIWDSVALGVSRLANVPLGTTEKMKECGDYLTLAGIVCILKEAVLQALESKMSYYGQEENRN